MLPTHSKLAAVANACPFKGEMMTSQIENALHLEKIEPFGLPIGKCFQTPIHLATSFSRKLLSKTYSFSFDEIMSSIYLQLLACGGMGFFLPLQGVDAFPMTFSKSPKDFKALLCI